MSSQAPWRRHHPGDSRPDGRTQRVLEAADRVADKLDELTRRLEHQLTAERQEGRP